MTHDADPAIARLAARAAEGCEESRRLLHRRHVLGLGAGLFAWGMQPRLASAATTDPRLLIVVMRGGADGLSIVVPYGDKNYASARRDLALAKADLIVADTLFGFHPSLKTFGSLFAAGQATAIHATCTPLRNRSHFDCQDNLESGLPGLGGANPTGWVNRLLTALPTSSPVRSHGALEIGDAPLILRGPAPVLGWSPTWFDPAWATTVAAAQANYDATDPAYGKVFAAGIRTDRLARKSGGSFGDLSGLRQAMTGAGRLLKATDGPRIAVVSAEGWDTHAEEGAKTGYIATALAELDTALADFKTAVGAAAWAQTVVVMATEFGRTVAVNGTTGSDHGVAAVTLLAGGAVAGGKIRGKWPGLAPANLFEDGNLAPTTDLRAVFKGIVQDHLGVASTILDTTIFPASAAVKPFAGLVRAPSASPALDLGVTADAALRDTSPIGRWRAGLPASGGRGVAGADQGL